MSDAQIPIIDIPWNVLAVFKERQNRFLGIADITQPDIENNIKVHIHDPGRLKDILYPGNKVLLRRAKSANRKTNWDLIAGQCNEQWVLVHSGFHRSIVEHILNNADISPFGKATNIKPEVKYGNSRLDFLLEKENGQQIWIEVKGCTLAIDGVALFPDAPTKRGSKHLKTLITINENGMNSAILMLVFRREATCFAPHREIDPEFSAIFHQALENGVEMYTLVLSYEDGRIYYRNRIPLCDVRQK